MPVPFGGRVLVLFSLPLAIWVLVSLVSVILVQHASRLYDRMEIQQNVIMLANEYRATLDMLRNEERVYIASSSPAALVRRTALLAQANSLFTQLSASPTATGPQKATLEIAGEHLQRWYYDISEQRIASHNAGKPVDYGGRGPEYAGEFQHAMAAFIGGEAEHLKKTKQEIEQTGRYVRDSILLGLALGTISIAVVIFWLSRLMIRSVDSLNVATEEIARGNMGARVKARGLNDDLARRFNLMARLIEERNRELMVLAELGGLLNSCTNIREIVNVFSSYADRLFHDKAGALYFIDPNRVELNMAVSWQGGEQYTVEHMSMDECWASRLGRAHRSRGNGTRCAHFREDVDACCLPLSAFGELVGILTFMGCIEEEDLRSGKQVSGMVAQQLALTFANVRLREMLRDQALRDPLTRLFNRRHLDEALKLELYRAKRHANALSVIALDVDRFKRVNDTCGHDAGDYALRSIAETLERFFRPEDSIFRSGGEKFTVLLPGTGKGDAVQRAEALRQTVAAVRLTHGDVELPPMTISLGVAVFPDDGQDGVTLLKAADRALYRAKQAGRNCVRTTNGGEDPHDGVS